MIKFKFMLSVIGLMVFSGCLSQREYDDTVEQSSMMSYYDYGFHSNSGDHFVDIFDTSLRANIGDVTSLDTTPSYVRGFNDEEYAEVEINVTTASGAAMALLQVNGGLGSDQLAPGAVHRFLGSSMSAAHASGEFHVGTIVCSGMLPGEWEYDDIGSRTEIRISELEGVPNGRRIDFTTTTSANDEATGHWDMIIESNEGDSE